MSWQKNELNSGNISHPAGWVIVCLRFLLLILLLEHTLVAAQSPAAFSQPERIVVVGDVHGDFKQLIDVLQLGEVIDANGQWIAGETHLVQMGDLPDRGDSTLKVVRFLMNLQRDAENKSGKVHVLVGNHDAMNVYGDLRYVTRQEYAEFEDGESIERLNKLYRNEIEWIKKNRPEEEWPEFDEVYRENWFKARPPGFYEHRINWQADGEIGKWVLSRNTVLRLGRFLFVHGGIGPAYADFSIEELNDRTRAALQDIRSPQAAILNAEEGPLWYRGLASNPEMEELPHLDKLLSNFDVEHVILGHTVANGVILPRFGGRVVLTDVGLSHYYGAHAACLVMENGRMFARYAEKQIPIPVGEGISGTLEYLQAVRELYPDNLYIQERIEEIYTIPAVME